MTARRFIMQRSRLIRRPGVSCAGIVAAFSMLACTSAQAAMRPAGHDATQAAVTGARTTEPPSLVELRRVKRHARVPVLIGSGLTPQNLRTYFPFADGFIVGSTFREGGQFLGAQDPRRLAAFMKVFQSVRSAESRS